MRYISDRVLVMYLGEVVELGPVDQVWDAPAHPYTRALLAAMPSSDPDSRTETPPISGDPPNPIDPPPGCRFHTRCPFAEPLCANATPKLTALDSMGHQAACYMAIPGSGHSRAPARGGRRGMTKPSPKEVKAMADVAGVPVDDEVATRIANSIGPAFEGFAPVAGTLAVRSRARELSARADREGVEMSTEPALMSLTAVARAIAEKKVSSREVTQSCLHRIAQWQPRLNAFMAIEAERRWPRRMQPTRRLPKGNVRGALHGVPLAHKDMYYDAGKVVTCGSQDPARFRRHDDLDRAAAPEGCRHDPARLAADGGVRLWADRPQRHYGAVHNPWNVDHITGGSSSGSGSAVAARLTFAALGSDTGGSIRMPAHFCGVTGLKTTVGRVSRAGAMPLSQSLDTVGPLARTAEDCALLLGLMAGADPEDPTASALPVPDYMAATRGSIKGLKIGVPTAFYVDDLDPEVARILDETIAVSQEAKAPRSSRSNCRTSASSPRPASSCSRWKPRPFTSAG